MRAMCVVVLAAALAIGAVAGWCEQEPLTITGTIVTMCPGQASGTYQWELRLDAPAGALKAGQGLTVVVRPERPGQYAAGLGDQVRMQISQSASGQWELTGGFEKIGRGELVNPGKSPSRDLGSPQARVLVKMFAPMQADCHRKTADLLQGIAEQEPTKVRVQIFDLTDPAAREEIARERLTCATVLVNNRYEFTLKTDGRQRAVQLWHKPNEPQSSYRSEDALAVVQQEIQRLYPPPAAPASAPPASSATSG